VSHIPYTICRSGSYYYNRRVPKHAVSAYGSFIRQSLSQDPVEAELYSKRLNEVLESSWSAREVFHPVDVASVIESFKPRSALLSEMAEEYLSLRSIEQTPLRVALTTFIAVAGDRDVRQYSREDTKVFVRHLTKKGNKTATIRRRVNSLSAILNFAYSELDLDKRNPFKRLMIQGEGEDSFKRGVFTHAQLSQGYDKALVSNSTVRLLMPILGETGCRLAEVVGLRLEDLDLQEDLIHIRPNRARRLKTPGSTRTLPLVGCARLAVEQVLSTSDDEWLFPRYIHQDQCKATHASNALNKWLKADFEGLTAHCLRHTMRDRLRAVECPVDMVDQIGGWSSIGGSGVAYGRGYSIDLMRQWLGRASLPCY
jgi:integrase